MKEVKISEILEKLRKGETRKEITSELGLTMAEAKMLFQHPKLKNRRKQKQNQLQIVDDLED